MISPGKGALVAGAMAGVLAVHAAVDIHFIYRDSRRAALDLLREKAEATAQRIDSFVRGIEGPVGWVTSPPFTELPADERRGDVARLLRQVPAITELAQLDRQGREQLRLSRGGGMAIEAGTNRAAEPPFAGALASKVYFSPAHFRDGGEPGLTMAVAHGGRGGVTVVEVDLKPVWEMVARVKAGTDGYAYAVDRRGQLMVHPDMVLVRRATSMGLLLQVKAALMQQGGPAASADGINRAGVEVLAAHAVVPALGWTVLVEQPAYEVRQSAIDAGLRALGLLVLGLLIAGLGVARWRERAG